MDARSVNAVVGRRRPVARIAVALSFVVLAAVIGSIVWAATSHRESEDQVARLVTTVDTAVGSASSRNPGLADRLAAIHRMAQLGEEGSVDVLSAVPVVEGAEPFAFSSTPDRVMIGYRGTSLAAGTCVRSVVSASGSVATRRWNCRASID